MTTTPVLLALAVALLLWPAPAPAARRVTALVSTRRLAGPATPRPRRRLPVPAPPGRRGAVTAGLGAGSVVGLFAGAGIGLATAIAVGTTAGLAGRAVRRRADFNRRRDLGAALRMLCAELSAGSSPARALAAAADGAGGWQPAFVAAGQAAAAGLDVSPALRAGGPQLGGLAGAFDVCARTGAPVVDVLTQIDADLRDRAERERLVGAALAGAQSSSALLAALPALGIALGAAMGAHPIAFLFGSPAGRGLLCAGVALDALGVLWTVRLTGSAQRA